MSCRTRQAFDQLCRDLLDQATERMDRLRSFVERSGGAGREGWERMLDNLRGERNRATARIEAARLADDDTWPTARAQADQAITDLMECIDDLDRRLQRLAA
ncbi:hypothetical protein [Azospirillum thermophilum]|uniref:hypothetical protein n=1 Tax=Azospirillum thermophilum TaxID=2202148 RepID=UPI00143CF5BF|nr:hypothetical protein [Azospirillum thermophilum]